MDEPILYLGDRGFLKRYGSPYSAQPNPEYYYTTLGYTFAADDQQIVSGCNSLNPLNSAPTRPALRVEW